MKAPWLCPLPLCLPYQLLCKSPDFRWISFSIDSIVMLFTDLQWLPVAELKMIKLFLLPQTCSESNSCFSFISNFLPLYIFTSVKMNSRNASNFYVIAACLLFFSIWNWETFFSFLNFKILPAIKFQVKCHEIVHTQSSSSTQFSLHFH